MATACHSSSKYAKIDIIQNHLVSKQNHLLSATFHPKVDSSPQTRLIFRHKYD